MIQAFSLIFNFYNIASPCGDMLKIFKGVHSYCEFIGLFIGKTCFWFPYLKYFQKNTLD
jgi:hypothetical protein